MKVMRYRSGRKRVGYRLFCFVLLLILFNFITVDTYAKNTQTDNNTNTISIKTKRVDYDNYFLYADIDIHLKLDANTESLYLILPISETPGIRFNKGHNSNRTILSGFLGRSGYFIIQFLPDKESGEVSLSLSDVLFTLYEPLDDVSFGSYELCFSKTKDNIPEYINRFIGIDEIRINDKNISSTIPATLSQGNERVFYSDAENISVSVIRVESIFDIGLKDVCQRLAVIFIAIVFNIAPFKNKILGLVKDNLKHKRVILVITYIVCILITIGFPFVALLLNIFKDSTIIVTYVSSLFIINPIGVSIVKMIKNSESLEDDNDHVLEENSDEDRKKEDEHSHEASTDEQETKEKKV